MASRFWVGNGQSWSDPAGWSATSGGAGGASVPTAADDVTFNASSQYCILDGYVFVRTLTIGTGFVNWINGGNVYTITTTITSGTALVMTPGVGATFNLNGSQGIVVEASAGNNVNVNVNLANINTSSQIGFWFNPTVATSTVTLLTNGNFTAGSDWYSTIFVTQGTFSTGTVNPTIGYLTGTGGTYNFNASTVTLLTGSLYYSIVNLNASNANIVVNLGTSVINGATANPYGGPQFIIQSSGFVTSVTSSAGQVLNVYDTTLGISIAGAQTLRTITARKLTVYLGSGTNLTAGVVTANEYFSLNAYGLYSVLPTFTATSITGTNSDATNTYIVVNEPGFTCGAITLSYTGGGACTISYTDRSKGAVSVTGTIQLSTNGSFVPSIDIGPYAAFSGTPTVTYAALNASVAGYIIFNNYRAVTTGNITCSSIQDYGSANVTVGAVTLGGTLSSVVYNGTFDLWQTAAHTFQATSFAIGTGATTYLTSNQSSPIGSNLTVTGAVTCTEFNLQAVGSVTIGGTLTCTANSPTVVSYIQIVDATSVSLAAVSISGTSFTNESALVLGIFGRPVGNVTISGAVTLGSSAATRFPLYIYSTGSISFSGAVTYAVSQLIAYDFTSLSFVASSTLTLDPNATGFTSGYPTDPLYLNSSVATSISLRAITCSYTNTALSFFFNTPLAAITFNASPTMGATAATRCNLYVSNCASFTCPAISTSAYVVTSTGAVTQSGLITIAGTVSPTPSSAVYIDAGGTSTVAGMTLASITDTSADYGITLSGAGALTISAATTGPTAAGVLCRLYIQRTNTTTFSGAISNITAFEHVSGNITFTGALSVGVRSYFKLVGGFTVTPNTSVITINGNSTHPVYTNYSTIDFAGYALNSVVFPATARAQIVTNTFNTTGLTVTSFSSTGAAVPNSYLQLGTDLTVTGSQLTIAPNSITNRHLVCSDQFGVARTITAATRTINTGVDFQDITAAGGVVPWNLFSLSAGNAGGNTNITFPNAVTRYSVNTGTVNWDATTTWSATSGGATGASVPLAHDTVSVLGSVNITTNGRVFLGSNTDFSTFTGALNITTGLAVVLGSVDMSLVPNTAVITGEGFSIQGRSAISFSPPAGGFSSDFYLVSTGNITFGGPNNLGGANIYIGGNTLTTNTGSRICDISGTVICVGAAFPMAYNSYSLSGSNNLNSSTVSGTSITLKNCAGTTAQITASSGPLTIAGAISFTNAVLNASANVITASAANMTLGTSQVTGQTIVFNNLSTLNSSAATLTTKTSFSSGAAWSEGTTQVVFKPESTTNSLALTLSSLSSDVVNQVSIDDINSGLSGTDTLTLTSTFTGAIVLRKFISSALRRPLVITGSFKPFGGLDSAFSDKGWTYFNTVTVDVQGTEPLYIPYSYVRNTTVSSGSVVAYGPANMGGNTGSITYPSRLRYYAFVNTTTTMTVPADYNGMGLFLAVGGGATPTSILSSTTARGGGGGGGTAYSFVLPINNLTAPVVPGQTLYVSAGGYATAPAINTSGGNGTASWINATANSIPSNTTQGAYALGGQTTTSNLGGNGGAAVISHIGLTGGAGGSASLSGAGGGGGGSSLFSGGTPSSAVGGGGAGIISAGSATGQGGDGSVTGGAAGVSGSPATDGTSGASATGAGGGGGGGNTAVTPVTVTTSSITRAQGSTTLVFNVTAHGLNTGNTIQIMSQTYLKTGTGSKPVPSPSVNVTVSMTAHGLTTSTPSYMQFSSPLLTSQVRTPISVPDANTFVLGSTASVTISTNVTLGPPGIVTNGSVYTVTKITNDSFSIVSSGTDILRSGQLQLVYAPNTAVNDAGRGGNGALSSAQYFIRYYNGVYTPGYFGIGAGGGGGGAIINPTTNTIGHAGTGGSGGIGSGGGGIGRPGSARTGASSVATSGQGGPGLVVFIYAVRRNNFGMIQGL